MKLETNLLTYLPDWYRQAYDYLELCKTETAQFEALANMITVIGDNFYFQTADETAISMWEQVLHIIPDPATESLDFRRVRVISRISTKPPFTLAFLYNKLDELIGPGAWNVTVDYPNYTLYIESGAKNQNYFYELAYTIGKIKPAHIVYINRPLVSSSIALTETIERRDLQYFYILGQWSLGAGPFASDDTIYNYKLGSWRLGQNPFGSDNQDRWEMIKMPNAESIQPALLNQTAAFVAGDVAQARINGNILIPAVQGSSGNGQAVITYTVTPAMASTVTQTELLDKDGNTLTSATVYVPVSGVIQFRHTIPVKEGDS